MPDIADLKVIEPKMIEIHAAGFDFGWKASQFLEYTNSLSHKIIAHRLKGQLTAFMVVSLMPNHETPEEAEILTLATDPNHRGKGHARALLDHLISELKLKQTCRLILEVATDNMVARHIYGQLGFEQVGLRKAYYKRKSLPPQDALILSLAL
jgi:[ribosomal protein S18]-alanine N-acetyltransferase